MFALERSTRRELALILAFTLLGAVLRFWGFGRLGLTHFDEGVYALAGLWSGLPGGLTALDPMVIPYAPPGFPIVVGLAYFVLGVSDAAALLAATVCGIATIPATAWVARRTFGPGAGAAGSALAALSMAHIAFSRKALTDAPFLLVWLLSIGLGGRFLTSPGVMSSIALGLAVGVAQNVKYNGWLLGALVAVAAIPEVLPGLLGFGGSSREGRRHALMVAGLGLAAAATSLLVYWPWIGFVERHGGYSALVRHHQSYVGGPSLWFAFWNQQLAQVVALSGGNLWCSASWLFALAGMIAVRRGQGKPPRWRRVSVLGAVGAVVFALVPATPWWIGLGMLPWLVRDRRPRVRLVRDWWILLSILTPLYHPYARLWLPLHAAGWLLMAGALASLLEVDGRLETAPASSAVPVEGGHKPSRLWAGFAILVVALGLGQRYASGARSFATGDFFDSSSALRDLVARLPELVSPGSSKAEIRVLGRRPLAYYLLLQGRFPFRLLAGPGELIDAGPGAGWTIIDSAVLGPNVRPSFPLSHGGPEVLAVRERLDPVTRLDVAPDAAMGDPIQGQVTLWVVPPGMAPRFERDRDATSP